MEFRTHGGSGSILKVERAGSHDLTRFEIKKGYDKFATSIPRDDVIALIREAMSVAGIELGEIAGGAAQRAHKMTPPVEGVRSAFA